MRFPAFALLALMAPLSLAGCALPGGPVQVTRFVADSGQDRLGVGTVFVQTAATSEAEAQDIAPYKAAVARELAKLGYREAARADAAQIAQVSVDSAVIGGRGDRSPVSVGVGGSAGTYGSGVGLGVGVNLGGGPAEQLSTTLQVMIRDARTNQSLWEGRAIFDVATKSILADSAQNAAVMAEALFRQFPGNNGETVAVPIQSNP